MTFRFGDREETYEAGDAYYVPPGHTPVHHAGAELVEFSPTEGLQGDDRRGDAEPRGRRHRGRGWCGMTTQPRELHGLELVGLDRGVVTLSPSDLDDLGASGGRMLVEGDDGWEDAVLLWNGMVARKPALVVQPTSAAEVAAAVAFARDHGLLLGVKGEATTSPAPRSRRAG